MIKEPCMSGVSRGCESMLQAVVVLYCHSQIPIEVVHPDSRGFDCGISSTSTENESAENGKSWCVRELSSRVLKVVNKLQKA